VGWEGALDAYSVGHFADCKRGTDTSLSGADDISLENLDSFFVTLFDFEVNLETIAYANLREVRSFLTLFKRFN